MYRTALALLAMSACAAPDECAHMPDVDQEFAALLDDVEAELGPLPAECASEYHDVTIVTDDSEMPGSCHRDDDPGNLSVLGCMSPGDPPHIWVLECQPDPGTTIRHERLHSLLVCLDPPGDPGHLHPLWRMLGVL